METGIETSVIRALRRISRGLPDLDGAYVYGSAVRGDRGPASDLDIAVLFAPDVDLRETWRLEDEVAALLSRALPGESLDLRALNHAPLAFQHEVIVTGRLVFSRSDRRIQGYESYVIRRWEDFRRYHEEYHRFMIAHVKEGWDDSQLELYKNTFEDVERVCRRAREAPEAHR